MKRQFLVFLVRWILNSFGLWIAINVLGSSNDFNNTSGLLGFLLVGLIFSVINSVIRPIVIIFSLPAILLSLGLFVLVVNGLMVYLAILLSPGVGMTFFNSILAGMLLSLINYILNATIELRRKSIV